MICETGIYTVMHTSLVETNYELKWCSEIVELSEPGFKDHADVELIVNSEEKQTGLGHIHTRFKYEYRLNFGHFLDTVSGSALNSCLTII